MTDTCPRCLRREIPPAAVRRREGAEACGYRCPCGHEWAVARHLDAYPQTDHPRHQAA